MRLAAVITLILATSITSACGDSTFGGSSGKRGGANQDAGSTDGDDDVGGSKTSGSDATPKDIKLPENPTKEQEAIGKCLAAWGSGNPFGKAAFEDYRKISASVSVLGGGGYAIEDTEITDGPKLILVSASVSVLGSTNYLLMNPNGWYCFMVDVNVLSKTTVDLQCKAKLADSRVAVNVLSKPSSTAAVGVNVLSTVKVNRMKDPDSKESCL